MKAVYFRSFGGTEEIEIRDVSEPPKPTGSQATITVTAAALNRADLLQRRGLYPPPSGYSPNIPGLEFAGVIEELGPEAQGVLPGDRVFGITAGEAQAEKVSVDARLLMKIPEDLSFVEAAAIPEAFITAHDAVISQGELKNGETLLVHAVGSGVGLAAVQIARSIGARVIGTSRTAAKLERARPFGLDDAVLAGEGAGFASVLRSKNGGGADVVLDLVGGGYFRENLECLSPRGRLLLVGLTSGRKAEFDLGIAISRRLRIIGTNLRSRSIEEKAEATKRLAHDVLPLIANGTIKPNLDRVFELEAVREAHEYVESDMNFGKVVLRL
ncbi:MAG TPA: NAD(P)H-quinone oxidoreductase [Pyrinomonadaceae bacterium]|nr:NAD(P)H-quinone oxidoreductase [Pyrinomonadaceae bacterium]